MVPSPAGSIHSLSAEPLQPLASTSTAAAPHSPPSTSLPSLGNIPPIPSTSGLHHVNEKGSTQGKHVPLDDSLQEGEHEPEAQDAEEDDDSSASSSNQVEESRPQSPSGLVDLGEPETPPPDPGEDAEGGSDDEGDSDDDEDSESDDEEEEEEPTLKYSRLGGGTTEILAKDSASALAVSTQYIVRLSRSSTLALSAYRPLSLLQALGTHNGAIFILDFQGNIVKRFRPHAAMINDLSIDGASEFVASASMDGEPLLSKCLNFR